MFAPILSHLLAVYVMLLSPWLGWYLFQKAKKQIQGGMVDAKKRLYRGIVVEQVLSTIAVLALISQIPASRLGLVPPRSWTLTISILLVVVVALVWSSLRLRPKADKIREKIKEGIGILLPDTARDRTWYGAVCVGAGISEELAFRGFLLYYYALVLPHANIMEGLLLSAAFFGIAHIYQGRTGMIGAGILGLAFGGLYVLTGSLLLPVVVHAVVDLRALLILPPVEPQAMAVEVGV